MIKIGDWVKVNKFNRVVKVISINANILWYYLDDAKMFAVEDDLTKLPIKFKGFEVLERVEISDTRYVKETDKMYHFSAIPSKSSTLVRVFVRLFVDGNWAYVVNSCSKNTIEQAKDWLELQYATMLAKARGLI